MRKETPALTPSSSQKQKSPLCKENLDPNAMPSSDPNSSHFRSKPLGLKSKSPLPPRPPSNPRGNPLKRKLTLETLTEGGSPASVPSDSGVQVIVRMRPLNKEEEESDQIAQKISPNSVSIVDHMFTFDSVADSSSTQHDIFQLVGLPLVENCLAGFNSSIFAYGQTGSGKTYTMWGPPSALSAKDSSSEERGLTPRVFERLFLRIKEEQAKHSDKQLTYQCRCSFLEIYNEQITDLLDPTQGNLQIREDVKIGIYVDCLTEENVCSMNDVVKLLDKGLANRRTGATSINSESSRSHCVFTCVVESRSKSTSDGLSNLRSSRINLVDLAGSERQKMTGAAGERLKEAGNINRSLSQLGNLINILAEVSQSGKPRHIPYRDSRLTFLLQESLGGNAKLAMICAISPSQSCKNETFSTLRFAQRAKAIKNKAVVNEVTQDDVNVLREQIRQLKDELLRMKSTGASPESNGSYSTGWNARRSLSLLRMSLNCPRVLPVAEDDSDEEMEIVDEDVEKASKENGISSMDIAGPTNTNDQVPETMSVDQKICDTPQKITGEDNKIGSDVEEIARGPVSADGKERGHTKEIQPRSGRSLDCISPSSLSIVPYQTPTVLQSPPLSISPSFENSSRKSLRTSSSTSASKGNILLDPKSDSGVLNLSFADIPKSSASGVPLVQTNTNSLSPTEHLEASLHRGLQIIDNHRYSVRQSGFRFSTKPIDLNHLMPIAKVDVSVQTLPEEAEILGEPSTYICSYCKNKPPPLEYNAVSDDRELQLVPIDASPSADKCKIQIPKAVEKVLAGAIRREMALEDHCAKQAAEILQLHRLIQQYKHERECSAVIEQTREDKISRLESLMDGILTAEDFMEEEFISLTNEHKFLKEKYESHPEVLRLNIELKRVQEELEGYRNFFDMGERDVLVEEIQDLKCQLQYYIDSSSISIHNRSPLRQLTHSVEPISASLSTIPESSGERIDEKLEEERRRWTEAESKWISLSEELRVELETNRSLAEKRKLELDSEKKCTEELKEALQTAMQGHARILEQYADLQEKHIDLHGRHRQMMDGIEDVRKAATRAGVKGAESKFIKSLAAEISALKAEREKERRYWRDEKKGLQSQLRDTAEAVQAAGELLVRLKEAEEAAATAQKRAAKAELETEKAYQEIDKLKKNYDQQIVTLNQFLAESRLPKEALKPAISDTDATKYDGGESLGDQQWREEFAPFGQGDSEFSRGTEPYSWFADYDRCNI
ncbi:uncharacterized protein A4U43_C04F20610 [Asparagus officinalis]|uniref:Kinesin motor domain-containing protein n=1 Tax=Asparagus officinalis TaxID=4686 RepID=A0A5P1F313_ASPOF|nr:kinesin-like protein KIN-12B [Asparagus officinalis]ONK72552.1 uncharacterized protein A4U43_C04F20610 [Asparagus officinalis]